MTVRQQSACVAGLLILLAGPLSPARADAPIPSPEAAFGHRMGADRKLVHIDDALPYYERLARESDRVALEHLGTTVQGRDLVMLEISTPENLAHAARYREIAARLADPRGASPAEIDSLVAGGKVILMVTLGIHATEIGATQMGLEWAYDLATGGADGPARYLEDVIVLLVPSMNPDGQAMVTEWYRKYVGTRYEGGDLPRLYHPYAGHDNNRDWFMLNLPETRAVNRTAYREWFPQVILDEHQMGTTGPRAFVPPYTDPVSPRVHSLIHRGSLLIGANMAMDLEQHGKSGVIYGYSFDAYWPGGTRSTPWWKNTVGILTEIASARVASPVYIDPGELTGGQKGLPDYRPQVNFPNPWPGGWWRLRDIVDYELIASNSALRTCSLHREDFLRNRALMAADAVKRGTSEAPYGYIVPPGQHDPGTAAKLVDLLLENGVEATTASEEILVGSQVIGAGSVVIPAAQPLRSFLVEMMEPQTYPEIRMGPDTDAIYRPYDVTSWSLPYLMGVDVVPLGSPILRPLERITHAPWAEPALVDGEGEVWALSPAQNDAYTVVMRLLDRGEEVVQTRDGFEGGGLRWPPGTFLTRASRPAMEAALRDLRTRAHRIAKPGNTGGIRTPTVPQPKGLVAYPTFTLHRPRVGIYQSWLAPSDEGWTRFVLDRFEFPYTVLHNRDIQAGNLSRSLDAVIVPSQTRQEILEGTDTSPGRLQEPRPEPYDGGLEESGMDALRTFVEKGGVLIALGDAVELATEDMNLPVRNLTRSLPAREFSTPGTMLRVTVNPAHPLGYGMPEHAMVYHTTDPVLGTQLPEPGSERSVVVRFEDADRVVASGWAAGTEILEHRAALVEVSLGRGRMDLFAFRPQYRGQTHGTYRMLLNALLSAASD